MSKKLTREVIEDIFYCTGDIIRDLAKDKFIKELERRGFLEEPLTFEKIRKECIPGDTTFIDGDKYQYTFLGFYDDKLLVGRNKTVYGNNERSIANWRIEK